MTNKVGDTTKEVGATPTPETPDGLLNELIHAKNCRRYIKGMDNTAGKDCTCFVGRYADAWEATERTLRDCQTELGLVEIELSGTNVRLAEVGNPLFAQACLALCDGLLHAEANEDRAHRGEAMAYRGEEWPSLAGLRAALAHDKEKKRMTRDEYNSLPSDGKQACPDCGLRQTHPFPNCGCPTVANKGGFEFTEHINKWHHTCGFDPRNWGLRHESP